MRTVSAVEPVKVTLLDEQEYQFLLTRGGMTRLKQKFEIATDRELLNLPAEQLMVPLLVEANWPRPGKLTEDLITSGDLLPVDIEWTARLVMSILGASMPDPRPTGPESTPANQ